MTKLVVHSIIAAALAGIIAGSVVWADQETIKATVVTATSSCAGKYTAYAKMTNSNNGTFWIEPPTNVIVTNGLFSDLSAIPQPYSSYTIVTPSGGFAACNSNHISFAATNGGKYQLMLVITNSPSPVTNGQQLTLDVQWNTP